MEMAERGTILASGTVEKVWLLEKNVQAQKWLKSSSLFKEKVFTYSALLNLSFIVTYQDISAAIPLLLKRSIKFWEYQDIRSFFQDPGRLMVRPELWYLQRRNLV